MSATGGTLQALTGGVRLKNRVQHPKVNECRDRGMPYWFFRYRDDDLLPGGTIKTTRKRRIVGPSKGPNAISRKQAEVERDRFLVELNCADAPCDRSVAETKPADIGAILFGKLADLWRSDFVERKIGERSLIAASTREKYIIHLENHIQPRWKTVRLAEFRAKEVLDWLQEECTSCIRWQIFET